MAKSDQTKQKLYETALQLFLKDGFDRTTMRAIASATGVAPGGIYYYFESKEAVIQEYYNNSHEDHELQLGDFLAQESDFEARLRGVLKSKIEVALPYRNVARALYRVAANPESPSSPFSEASKELRLKSLHLFEEVVAGSKTKFSPEVRKLLPKYLWLFQMGVILFWIYDESKDSKKTFELIDQTVPLIAWMNTMIQSPLSAPFRKKIMATLEKFEPQLS